MLASHRRRTRPKPPLLPSSPTPAARAAAAWAGLLAGDAAASPASRLAALCTRDVAAAKGAVSAAATLTAPALLGALAALVEVGQVPLAEYVRRCVAAGCGAGARAAGWPCFPRVREREGGSRKRRPRRHHWPWLRL